MSLEKLDLSVALKLAFVEDSLCKVEQYRHHLQENAQKVKEEIHEVVDRQVGSLRMRERQLMRQVEVVTAHETCRLSTQQAQLMHSKGALTATSDLLDRCVNSESGTLAKIKVDEMYYSQGIKPAKRVSVQLDETGLTSAISQFGSVQLPDTITHHPSPVIPVKVEEYEDEEHDVLHKSVAYAAAEPSAPMHIKVQFPRLTNHSWLFRQNGSTSNACTPLKPIVTRETKHSDVAAWLGDLSLSAAMPKGDSSPFQCSDGFDMVGTPASSESSSIEIVPPVQDKECSSPSSGMCEIENIHTLISDKSRWLSSRTPEEARREEKLDVTSACMANETCQSFQECVCQNKCRMNALEKLQQTADFKAKTSRKRTFSEAEGIHSILNHMAKILASENSQWLLRKQGGDSPRPPKYVMYESPGDTWLCQGSGSPTRTFPRAQLASHCNTWLLKNLKNQKNTQEKDEKEREKCIEKDNRITSEALSEALKRVCVDPCKSKCAPDESCCYSDSHSLPFKEQPWLLARKGDSNKQASKDQWQEKEKDLKPLWLFSPQESCTGKQEASTIGVPGQLHRSLSPLHVEVNSWLLH